MDGCRRRSETRKMSSQTSGPTVDESHELARRDSPVTNWMSTEWTDEKHRLYLKSMEASFVDQLYNSMDLLGWNSQKEISDPKFLKHVNRDSCTSSSGQFKVLRQGVWQKVNLQNRPELQRDVAMETPGLLSSPWIQRFISARKPQVVPSSTTLEAASAQTHVINRRGKKTTSCGSTRSLKHSHPSHSHDMVDGNTEVSDQNFVDQDVKGGKESTCSPKRMKTLMVEASGSDQVASPNQHPFTGLPEVIALPL